MREPAGCYKSGRFIMRRKILFNENDGLSCTKVCKLLLDMDNRLIAGTEKGLFILKGGRFSPYFENRITGKIGALSLIDGAVAFSVGNELFFAKSGKLKSVRKFDSEIIDVAFGKDGVWVLTSKRLVCFDNVTGKDIVNRSLEGGRGICLAVSDKEMYAVTESYLSLIHGKRREWKNIIPKFSNMPDKNINSLNFDESGYLWMGTESGAVIYDTASRWLDSKEVSCLPSNPVFKTAWDKVGGIYFATDVGIAYLCDGRTKYFSSDRWIPDNKINDIAVSDDGNYIYAATDKGISLIKSEYTTLSEKAEYYENIIEKYHIRRGFTANRELEPGYDMDKGSVHISDNDGLWTGCYVAAESFRYSVTGDKKALGKARRGLNAMLLLTQITGIPGFTARAVRYPGEKGFGNGDREWHLSPDKSCEWKGETSSDEMTGHFFGMSIYYDLCANKAEKLKIKNALCGIMDHIIANNYRLVDVDGLPTTWACWDPAALNLDERWFSERGINSLEFLGFLKVCSHISADKKYDEIYSRFVTLYHYPLNVMRHKVKDAHYCHIDDNLAFLASLTLLRLEDNECVRSAVLCGMEDHWEYERPERQPMFAFIHAAATGRDDDVCEGVRTLREIPYDLIHYKMENSKRRDLVWDPEQAEWHNAPQIKSALPYDEINVDRPDSGSFRLDSPGGGAQDPTVFLLPYWIGRYYGIISGE